MSTPLPPLSTLPVFEAAARLGSFKRAAAELSVTPSAVSHQIRQLEEHLGVVLFERLTREVRLTEVGADYAAEVREALTLLRFSADRARLRNRAQVVRLSAAPLVAQEILVPGLRQLQRLLPNVELRIESSVELVDFDDNRVDAAVRFGRGEWRGVRTRELVASDAFIVCSPELASRVRHPRDIADHPLLCLTGRFVDTWYNVGQVIGVAPRPENAVHFDSQLAVMCAAAAGQGFAVGISPLTDRWVSQGRLASPSAQRWPTGMGFYFVYREGPLRPELEILSNWLADAFNAG